jgi:hypothetical protein
VDELTWTDGHGREVRWEVKPILTVADYRGAPGHALMLVAANRHMSVTALERLLDREGIERSRNWIQRRRWLFEDWEKINKPGERPNADGKDAHAIAIMRDNPKMSARALARFLSKNGIRRGKDWVLKHRCG